jgi:hypothetical protein
VNATTAELAQAAARLVVEEGLEYAAAKRRAARDLGPSRTRPEMPSNEDLEREVRDYLALFCAETQPVELRALREVALAWLDRLAEFRPHLGGAVWRGTATRRSAIHIDLYADDPKSPEIALINLRVDYDTVEGGVDRRGEPRSVLAVVDRCPAWPAPVAVFLAVHDHDELRGALRPDAGGRTWRGDVRALARLLAPAQA